MSFKASRRDFVKIGATAMASMTTWNVGATVQPAPSILETTPLGTTKVVIYPAPDGEVLSSDYIIEINGQSLPVYTIKSQWHDRKYSAAYFDFSGTVTVKIRPNLSILKTTAALDQLAIRPSKYGIAPVVADGIATFTTNKQFDISFEPTGQNSPLHLFSNPIEVYPPKEGDPDVIYFGPGVHKPTRIDLTAGQTLYIAGGAIVKSAVTSTGDNIRIMGRGILCGNDWAHSKGPTDRMVWPADGQNILLENIIIRGSWTWTVAPSRCNQVLIRNLRICGSRCSNDDGIDPCNSSNVTMRNCFVHTDDDGIAVKGTANLGQKPKTSENIVVEDCTFWIDFANVFRIGAESYAHACRNFVARNIDVIHFPSRPEVDVIYVHPMNNMPMENLVFEEIRINGEAPLNLIRLTPQLTDRRRLGIDEESSRLIVPGDGPYIHNVSFKNIKVYGQSSGPGNLPRVYLEGLTERHDVANVTFDSVILYGQLLSAGSENIEIEKFVDQVRFNGLPSPPSTIT